MASKRVQLTITAQRFFDDAQNKREAVRVWSLPWKLPYYIEKWDSQNEQAKVWVKVPKIPAGGSVDLYIYYGSPTAESESDGEAVFEFFDDFEEDSLDTSKWVIVSGTWQVESGALHYVNSGGDSFMVGQFSTQWNTKQYVAETRIKEMDICCSWGGIGIDSTDNASAFYRVALGESGPYFRIQKKWTPYSDVTVSAVAGHWYIMRIWQDETKVYGELREGEAGDNYYNLIVSNSLDDNSLSSGKIVLTGYEGDVYFDWVRVRKYAEQEPSVSVGSEESSDVSGWLYRRKITITNPNSYDLEHFQVAIDLDSSNFDFSKANSDGSDIRVTYGEGRYELPYYIDTWDTATPQAIIWVGIDSETKFYIELNPANTTDESDASVMNLDEATNYSLNKFEKYT